MAHDLQILGFGAIAVDNILYVDRPLSAGKGRVTSRIIDHGGNVATALAAAAKLGARAGFIGWLGEQPPNDLGARELAECGVDISLAPRRPDAKAIQSVITVGSDGERFIAFDDDVPHGTSGTLADDVLAPAKVLMVDAYAVHALSIVARARQLRLSVVADIEWATMPATEELMALANHLVLPLAFAQTYTRESSPAAIARKLWSADRAAVILTDGGNGAYVRQTGENDVWYIPSWNVRAVDTTGAGDCFHGAYAFALTEGKPPLACAMFANAAAAIAVTGKGGRKSLPDNDACLAMMEREDAPVPVRIAAAD